MDIAKSNRNIQGYVTTINNKNNKENIKECLKIKAETIDEDDTPETDLEKRYSIRDSIVFKEELEDITVDETSSKQFISELENQVSFRDLIEFKEDLLTNMDTNVKPDRRHLDTVTTSVIKIKSELSNDEDTVSEPDFENHQSFKNSIVFKEDLEDFYENHTSKEEIIIGPEVFQVVADLKKGIIADTSSVKNNKRKLNKKEHKQICKCGKKFTSKICYDKHTCKIKYICDHCGKRYISKHSISRHMQIHLRGKHNRLPYDQKCTLCPKTFRIKTTLEKHMEMHKNPHITQELHKCDICNKVFTLIHNLNRHINIHLGTVFQCGKCSKSYRTNEGLQRHKAEHYDFLRKESIILCSYCSKVHYDKSNCNRHERFYCLSNPERSKRVVSRDTKRIMQCDICQKTYRDKQNLVAHILLHMGKNKQDVKCDVCFKTFTKKCNLKYHMESVHINAKNHTCKICKVGFNRRYRLTLHEKNCPAISQQKRNNDDSKNKFGCDLCPRKYKTKPGLRFHKEAKHSNVKDYVCKNCDVRFTRKWSLKCHENRCHTQAHTVNKERPKSGKEGPN